MQAPMQQQYGMPQQQYGMPVQNQMSYGQQVSISSITLDPLHIVLRHWRWTYKHNMKQHLRWHLLYCWMNLLRLWHAILRRVNPTLILSAHERRFAIESLVDVTSTFTPLLNSYPFLPRFYSRPRCHTATGNLSNNSSSNSNNNSMASKPSNILLSRSDISSCNQWVISHFHISEWYKYNTHQHISADILTTYNCSLLLHTYLCTDSDINLDLSYS